MLATMTSAAIAMMSLGIPHVASASDAPSAIPPLQFKGEPIFVLGTYDAPRDEDAHEWAAAGGNAFIIGSTHPPTETEAFKEQLKERIARVDAWELDAAYIYFPGHVLNDAARDPALLPKMQAHLKTLLDVTADHPQTLGYWTYDEPENQLHRFHKEQREKGNINIGLGPWLAEELAWSYEMIKELAPEAYVMPTIAWWNMYEDTEPLYDVNVPNEYPTYFKDEPLTGPLYNVVYDASKAAEAVRGTGKSFVYMPGICDNWPGDDRWRAPTRLEMRYLYFAPVTQGAQGILGWRLGRASLEYRRAVIYPTMREVDALAPWFLGEVRDELVTSNRSASTAEYLREFPERIQTVVNEGRLEHVPVEGIPDVSYIVRQKDETSYLLLAVNNRKEPVEVTFTLSGFEVLPDAVYDRISWRRYEVHQQKIHDEMEPFAVRAYVLNARAR
ncbi:hypothetical protein ACERK3_01620 [Phycisphaerales bacterium AB-hyl4]|uniref:Uncharacterized protein n=1 Tax=Natronomicrosphaera hydrolytica TaxID=3242702 RepID=A0ABV4U2A6_9BACT